MKIDETSKEMKYTYRIPPYSPISVYKCLVKMAITLVPQLELGIVKDVIKWLNEDSNSNFYKNGKKLIIRFQLIPGFDVTKYPHYILYKRKNTCFSLPYLLFHLTYGCLSIMIEVPTQNAKDYSIENKAIPFAPVPFYTSSEWIKDFTSAEIVENEILTQTFKFDEISQE